MTNSLPTVPRGDRTNRRVLIVEDHADFARCLAALLRRSRFDTWTITSGTLAYPAALSLRPDSILLDLGLPGLDGYGVAEAIRGDASLDGVVLIAMSVYASGAFPGRPDAGRFDHHLVKPIDLDRLLPLLTA